MQITDEMVESAAKAHTPQFDRMASDLQEYALIQMRSALEAALSAHTAEKGEAVDWQWRALEDGSPSTYWKGPNEGDRPGWEAIAARRPDTYTIEKRFLYAHPAPPSDLVAEVERLRAALEKIERWFGEFPETGKFWENDDGSQSDRPMSYGACYGSNGERDFMRLVARAALSEGRTDA